MRYSGPTHPCLAFRLVMVSLSRPASTPATAMRSFKSYLVQQEPGHSKLSVREFPCSVKLPFSAIRHILSTSYVGCERAITLASK